MEFLLVFSFHYLTMGSLVMLISGISTYFIRQIHFLIIVLLCVLVGYFYSIVFDVPGLALFSIVFNAILSLIAIGLVKAGLYAKQKAEELLN
ncbi:hypothetical protein [Pseudalkalibacillus salsuginis]|uniref:hypothetical protein n=1 Tax=Pseudalkalibacillus salsuginis TaxID=2910972 RepID=UPI001F48F109|nr:hypothetical protein [Pseudalkalibacillus salsuginis]MCF6409945.1 hypothetical protein [Pseudalkalibacillus salsuginis]